MTAALLCGIGLGLCLLLAPASKASSDPLGSGTTKLTLDRSFLQLMEAHGVIALAKAPATRKGNAFAFPISEGQMDPVSGKGKIHQEGSFAFKRGNLAVPFRRLMLKTKRAPLYSKVGGSQLKVATGARIASARNGFGTVFTATGMKLSEKVAVRLNKKLHLADVFKAGQVIGSLRSEPQPQTVAILPSGRAALALAPEMVAKLTDLHVSLNPISPAELAPGPLFTFPITAEGAISPDASLGTLRTGGAMEMLQLGAGQIFWQELRLGLDAGTVLGEVNIQPSPPYAGKQEQVGVLDLDMGSATVSTDAKARTISVAGAALRLQSGSAASFNQAFARGAETFKAGEVFGAISFTAQSQ